MKLTSRPPITISPESASSRPATARRIVLFPHPDGPSRTRNSPSAMRRETSLTASTFPYRLTRCLIRMSATTLLPSPPVSLLQRAGHRGLNEPALEDQEDDEHGQHRHHGRGRDHAPVGHELPLQRGDAN